MLDLPAFQDLHQPLAVGPFSNLDGPADIFIEEAEIPAEREPFEGGISTPLLVLHDQAVVLVISGNAAIFGRQSA
jgi:hypothetical protein